MNEYLDKSIAEQAIVILNELEQTLLDTYQQESTALAVHHVHNILINAMADLDPET